MDIPMNIQKIKQKYRLHSFIAVFVAMLVLAGTVTIPHVMADRFDDQINALQQQNNQNKDQANALQIQANSYQETIDKLQAQVDVLQKQIDENKAKQADLESKIKAAEEELAKQRRILGENIKAMYLEGQISTLEMLASSKDLSEFVDKQQYRNSVKDKIKETLDKANALKDELREKKTQVEKVIKDQQSMQDALDSSKSQQAQLLGLTVQQKAAFDQKIKENNGQIAALRAQQAAENARLFSGSTVILGSACDTSRGDTYPSPWCSSTMDSMFDSWGMYNRECVSYTAWKVAESGRRMPPWGWQARGNANQWDDNARGEGIPVDSTPRVGDVAISNRGEYGHAMYVDGVNSDGTINISQYNADLRGNFSRVYNYNYRAYGLVFIHF